MYPYKKTDRLIGELYEGNNVYQSHTSKYGSCVDVEEDCRVIYALIKVISKNINSYLDVDLDRTRFRIAGLRSLNHFGDTETFDDKIMVTINPNLNTHWVEYALHILHELVHCNQYQTGRLTFNASIWEGKRYPSPKTEEEYLNLPWEKEAFIMQHKLFKQLEQDGIFKEISDGKKSLYRKSPAGETPIHFGLARKESAFV